MQRFTELLDLSTFTIRIINPITCRILPRFQSFLSAIASLICKKNFRFHIFSSFSVPTSRRQKPLRHRFPYPHSSCRALFPSLVTWTCVRTFVRVHYKHVHRRGVSRLNIDMLLKLNRIDGKNDDIPHSAPPFLPACFVRRHRYWCHLDAQSRVRRCVFAQAYRVFFLVSPRGPSALATGKSNPKARQTMRSPSEAPAATQPVCGNIYTEVACTRPSLRPCIPLRGSQSPPRFLKIHRKIGSIECSHISLIRKLSSFIRRDYSVKNNIPRSRTDCSNFLVS